MTATADLQFIFSDLSDLLKAPCNLAREDESAVDTSEGGITTIAIHRQTLKWCQHSLTRNTPVVVLW